MHLAECMPCLCCAACLRSRVGCHSRLGSIVGLLLLGVCDTHVERHSLLVGWPGRRSLGQSSLTVSEQTLLACCQCNDRFTCGRLQWQVLPRSA